MIDILKVKRQFNRALAGGQAAGRQFQGGKHNGKWTARMHNHISLHVSMSNELCNKIYRLFAHYVCHCSLWPCVLQSAKCVLAAELDQPTITAAATAAASASAVDRPSDTVETINFGATVAPFCWLCPSPIENQRNERIDKWKEPTAWKVSGK